MEVLDTTATKKIFKLRKRIRAVKGGTSASKTFSIIVWFIAYAQTHHDEVLSIVSESFPHLSGGAIRDFENIMKAHGYFKDKDWVRRDGKPTYTFETGTIIEFLSVDTYGKAHGPRRDVLFMNECNNMSYKIADQLITRTRKIVWLDWNPTSEFWFDEEMLGKRDDIDYITLTYLDNEALEEEEGRVTIKEIESHRGNKMWWQVYGLGQLGEIETRIYTGWKIIDSVPHEARLERYGLDFGYTNDPSAIVAIYYYNGGYIWDEIMYRKGLKNKMIADVILNQPKEAMVIADSAEPKSIDEISDYGVMIRGAQKGKDSVNNGIGMVQEQQISVTRRSINIIKEYRNYLWQEDKDGKIINKPEDIWNHTMDAGRYGMSDIIPVQRRDEFIKAWPKVQLAKKLKSKNPAL